MKRPAWIVPLAVVASSFATCQGSMAWQSRWLEVRGKLPDAFFVLAQTREGPKALNLASEHGDVRNGWYVLPEGVSLLNERERIRIAATALSKPDQNTALRLESFAVGPPARLSMVFHYDDFTYWSEYEASADGRVHPIASKSLVMRMGVVALFHMLLAAFVTWCVARIWLVARVSERGSTL